MESDGAPRIRADGVTVDDRDVRALRAIDEWGSLHRAAGELGRSYARLHQRIVELEDAFGSLVDRERGGADGGGSTLTANARRLLGRFDRLRAEFAGLTRAEESVFTGRVVDRTGRLGTVDIGPGRVMAIVPPVASSVQVSIRSDAVVVTAPDETPNAGGTSLRNRFVGEVESIDVADGFGRLAVDIDAGDPLFALVTEPSVDHLSLAPHVTVVVSFKATATRAIRVEPAG